MSGIEDVRERDNMENGAKAYFENQYPDMQYICEFPYDHGLIFVYGKSKDGAPEVNPYFLFDPKTKGFLTYNPAFDLEGFKTILQKIEELEG